MVTGGKVYFKLPTKYEKRWYSVLLSYIKRISLYEYDLTNLTMELKNTFNHFKTNS